jgi:hypothetical protein
MAWQPQPAIDDSGDIWSMTSLSWTPGDGARDHFVYVGTDPDAVAAADVLDTTGIYRGYQSEASYVIPEKLDFETTYYWRVDESGFSEGMVILTAGRVWSFSTEADIVLYDTETPFDYDTGVDPFMSDISLDLDPALDLTEPIGRLAVNYTGNAAAGSVTVDDAAGTTTIVGRGADIWGTADEFQYAYTTLTGDGSMTVKVDSLAHTDNWTKAGIMIRESLDAGSAFAAVYATGTNGVRFQARMMTDQDAVSDTSVATDEQKGLTAPIWIKIERAFPMISAYYSTDGVAFTPMSWNPQVIPMTPAPIYIGLAVTSHSGDSTYADAVFSEISSDGGVLPGPLTSAEIGLTGNAAAPMSLVLEDASGASAAVVNPDPDATLQTSATDFVVTLADFGIDLTAVTKFTLVIGDGIPGGSGSLTINSVSLLGIEKPVGHWTLDETSGTTAADSSGNGNDGTLNGDPVWATGIVAGALEFDGVDDYVDCGNPAILDPGTGDFTISAWIKGSVDPGTDTLIFSKGGDSGGGIRYELMLRDNNNGDIKVLVDDDNDKYDPSSDTVGLLDGAWHHIVGMRRNGTDLRVYIDGVEDMGVTNHNESTIPETYDLSGTSQANAHIGANWHNEDKVVQKFFLGLIDDVRVYHHALSEGEIAQLVAGL